MWLEYGMTKNDGGVPVQTRKAHDRVDESVDDIIKEAWIKIRENARRRECQVHVLRNMLLGWPILCNCNCTRTL